MNQKIGKETNNNIYMRISFFMIILNTLLSTVSLGQTVCFVQTKQIENGQGCAGDNSVLFLTITPKGCYDSDKEGISVENGFLKYVGTKDGVKNYRGDSYWGDAIYRLKSDNSKLNVIDMQSGIIYVYEKRNFKEVASTTSSKIKLQSTIQTSGSHVVLSPPILNGSEHAVDVDTKTVCYVCKGTRREKVYITSLATAEGSQFCSECNEMMPNYNLHIHRVCSGCSGKGYY